MSAPANTPDEQDKSNQVPLSQKIAWGAGGIMDNIMSNGIMQLALPIYQIGLGLDSRLVGWALFIPRIFDGVIDPLIGNLSDNTRSRWGRRRPFIVAGAVLGAIAFAGVWMPPLGRSQNVLFAYFLILSIIYYFGYAMFTITQGALGYEMSTDYHERTRIMAWKNFFANASGFLLPWLYKLSLLDIFTGTHIPEGVKKEVIGVRTVGILVGVFLLATGVIPALLCKERTDAYKQPKINIFKAIGTTFRIPAFMILSGIIATILVGLFLVNNFAIYINIYYVCKGNKDFAALLSGYVGTGYATLGILAIPVITWLSRKWGKRKTMIVAQISVILSSLSSWWLFTPAHPYLQLIPPILSCPGLSCVWLLSGSMMADICDLDELKNGLRQEGIFGAIFALLFKGSLATVLLLSGYMLVWSGVKPDVAPSDQSLWLLRVLFAGVPAVCVGISVVLASFFPVTEKSAHEVRVVLDARKKAKAEAEQQAEAVAAE